MRLWLAAIMAIGVIVAAIYVNAEQRASVVTCTVQPETATGNSRAEAAYYECVSPSGAIIPSVSIIVQTDSPGELWLRELVGRTVDVRLEVVR